MRSKRKRRILAQRRAVAETQEDEAEKELEPVCIVFLASWRLCDFAINLFSTFATIS
jgi:hypothetical protein